MFKGTFKLKNTNGTPNTYSKGDVVLYQGKMYECLNTTQKTPIQNEKYWKFTGVTQVIESESPPVKPQKGQIWVSSNGISYVWYDDGTSFQWIAT
jgi:hypothetical protein